ncbi:MAG: ribosomal protein S18-alanine N-acetyltransferase [Acidimicrobiia bacterium]|nr:ribosomal protein S18-alanine N-acetyltransferase [Acidimicrobiia bacterium]
MTAAIRDMNRHDIPAVATLEQAIYDSPWSVRVFYDELALANRRYIVAEEDETIVGYGGMLIVENDGHITTLAVDPRARRQRLGTRMMVSLIDVALEMGVSHVTLEVRMSNEAAQALYQRFGFAPVGLRKNYYRDEDALVMWANDIDGIDYQARMLGVRKELEAAGYG